MDQILIEIFSEMPQGAPGDYESTVRAFKSCKDLPVQPVILDIGCGTGRQTLDLTKITDGYITALDLLDQMLEIFKSRIQQLNLSSRITCIHGDMTDMKFEKQSFDLIWGEGSIYNIGFRKGLEYWKKYLKAGGYIAVTDLVWTKSRPPDELTTYFSMEYPGMLKSGEAIHIVKKSGYQLIDTFPVSEKGWQNYYQPLKERIKNLREKYIHDEKIGKFLDIFDKEMNIYERYKDYFDYMFFVMQKNEI